MLDEHFERNPSQNSPQYSFNQEGEDQNPLSTDVLVNARNIQQLISNPKLTNHLIEMIQRDLNT